MFCGFVSCNGEDGDANEDRIVKLISGDEYVLDEFFDFDERPE